LTSQNRLLLYNRLNNRESINQFDDSILVWFCQRLIDGYLECPERVRGGEEESIGCPPLFLGDGREVGVVVLVVVAVEGGIVEGNVIEVDDCLASPSTSPRFPTIDMFPSIDANANTIVLLDELFSIIHSFVHSFIRSFINSLFHSFIHSFVHSFVRSYHHSTFYWIMIHKLVNLLRSWLANLILVIGRVCS